MKFHLFIVIVLFSITSFAQNTKANKQISKTSYSKTKKIEDKNGHLIIDSLEREAYFIKKQKEINKLNEINSPLTLTQTAVQMCSNGSFEEFETINSINYLKNFQYTVAEPINPIQCKSVTENSNQNIKQYDPNNVGLMATTVPSNYLDEYIGNIDAFDQYTLKINHKNSSSTMSLVQAQRFKTNNESTLNFNYKAVLQSITNSGHIDEQPYFKARILDKNGNAVSEFCVIGDPSNCIFTQSSILEAGSIVMYTKNWQSGVLDISSIPNNEEFTIEFMATRCGLGAHFGYAYIDDICLPHSSENLQGSIELDPLYKICPNLPISVCGNYTLPNSGGIAATVSSITLNVYNDVNTIVYSTSIPLSLDLINHKFCFNIDAANLPNTSTGNYNVGVTISYGIVQTTCSGTSFASANDNDANPGWDISFMNCSSTCNFTLQTGTLELCDTNHDGKEFFNLNNVISQVIGTQTGLTLTYFASLNDAMNDTNPIASFLNYESTSTPIFVRVTKDATCFKIIAIQLIVKNPTASISGILNVCSGSTILTASSGASYLWSNGSTTQTTSVNTVGTYTVIVTDTSGCIANGSVTIIPNQVAVQPTIQIIQPTCLITTGTITITSPASDYSFDGGATWSTSASMSNLSVGNYIIKIKTASGCISYNTTVTVLPYFSTFPSFSYVNTTSCSGTGSITINTIAPFYSFDDGLTWSTSNTASNLSPGTYFIRTKDISGCISNYNSVVLASEFLPAPLSISNQPYCNNLGSIVITSLADQYSFDGGTTWQTSNTLSNLTSGSYIIKIKNSQGCTSPNVYVYLNNLEQSYPQYILTPASCGTYAEIKITTIGDLYSFDGGNSWTTNSLATNLTSYTSYSIMVRIGTTCNSLINTVYVGNSYLPIPVANDYQVTLCDDLNDGSENVNLTMYNSNLISNSSNYNFTYYNSLLSATNANYLNLITNINFCNLSNTNNTVYVRITSSDSCYTVAELKFTFIQSPIFAMPSTYILCKNSKILINSDSGFASYLWSTGEITQAITVTTPGNYWVMVTENHGSLICSSTKNLTVVLSNPATISHFETSDWTETENIFSVFVTSSSIGIYEYSLDGVQYQDSNTFSGLENGEYTVYIRDKNECGRVSGEVFLLMYPKYFTPNGDGFNDKWKIKFSNTEPGLRIKLFDKYGKFIKELDYSSDGWNGTFNGKELPSTDYWFVVTRANGKEYRGHFAMKR
jgi:gliding motility-associated-like protein